MLLRCVAFNMIDKVTKRTNEGGIVKIPILQHDCAFSLNCAFCVQLLSRGYTGEARQEKCMLLRHVIRPRDRRACAPARPKPSLSRLFTSNCLHAYKQVAGVSASHCRPIYKRLFVCMELSVYVLNGACHYMSNGLWEKNSILLMQCTNINFLQIVANISMRT